MSTTPAPSRLVRALTLRDRSIQTQIITVVLVLGAVTLGAGWTAMVQLRLLGGEISHLGQVQAAAELPGTIDSGTQRAQHLVAQLATLGDTDAADAVLAAQGENDTLVQQAMDDFAVTELATGEDWTAFVTAYEAWRTTRDSQLVPAALSGEPERYLRLQQSAAAPLVTTYEQRLAAVQDAGRTTTATIVSESTAGIAQTRTVLISAVVAAVMGSVALGLSMARRMSAALQELRRSIRAMAKGDFTVAPDVAGRDEIGRAARDLADAKASLRSTLG